MLANGGDEADKQQSQLISTDFSTEVDEEQEKQALGRLQAFLSELQAREGVCVEIKELPDGRKAIVIVSEESYEYVDEMIQRSLTVIDTDQVAVDVRGLEFVDPDVSGSGSE